MAAPMLREPPVTKATLPASFLVVSVFMMSITVWLLFVVCSDVVVYLRNYLSPQNEFAQYHFGCAVMLFGHNGTQKKNVNPSIPVKPFKPRLGLVMPAHDQWT